MATTAVRHSQIDHGRHQYFTDAKVMAYCLLLFLLCLVLAYFAGNDDLSMNRQNTDTGMAPSNTLLSFEYLPPT